MRLISEYLHESQEKALGEKLIKMFGLKKLKLVAMEDRFQLHDGYGDKTALGIAREVLRIVDEVQKPVDKKKK